MKKLISILCVLSIIFTGASVIASEEDAVINTENYTLKYSEVGALAREKSPTIKSMIAQSNMSAYQGASPISDPNMGHWSPGSGPESNNDKAFRLAELEKIIDKSIVKTENTFITCVSLENNLQNALIDIDAMEEGLKIQELLYNQGKLSKIEFESYKNNYESVKHQISTIEMQLNMLKGQLNMEIGRDVNAPLTLDKTIPYNTAVLDARNYEKDMQQAIDNDENVSNLSKMYRDMAKLVDADDNSVSRAYMENAKAGLEQVITATELIFMSSYNGLDSAYNQIILAEKNLENQKQVLEIAQLKYDSGIISKQQYNQAKGDYDKSVINVLLAKNSFTEASNTYNSMINGEKK